MARKATGGLKFHHPAAFWAGTAAVTAGVLLHEAGGLRVDVDLSQRPMRPATGGASGPNDR